LFITPGQKPAHDARIGPARVFIVDRGFEKFFCGKDGVGTRALQDGDRRQLFWKRRSTRQDKLSFGFPTLHFRNDNILYRPLKEQGIRAKQMT
jgi:hypothetical protein